MKWKTAFKIYMSKTHSRKKGRFKPITRGDWVTLVLFFWAVIPLIIILVPFKIYRLKEKGGISKRYRKYYSYYKKQC